MICRHSSGDPDCSKNGGGYVREMQVREKERLTQQILDLTRNKPDASDYEITRIHREGPHLVLEVAYPSCAKCSYEGKKVMVFTDIDEMDALRWRRIDPHFRDPGPDVAANEAPGPVARFPASEEGWGDAILYATRKGERDR